MPQGARSLVDKMGPGLWYMDTKVWYNRDIPDEEKPIFADLLRKLLDFSPENRIGARVALEHEWFRI